MVRSGVEVVVGRLAAGQFGHAPVVVGVLQGLADRGAHHVFRHVAHVHVGAQAVVAAPAGRTHGQLQGLVPVHACHALGGGIGQHAHPVVADHAPVFVGPVAPDRQGLVHALFAVRQHGEDGVAVVFGLKEVEPRMQSAVGVPERKDGEVGEAFGAVHVSVEAAVLAVYVLEDMRCNQAVVKRGVEGGLVVRG